MRQFALALSLIFHVGVVFGIDCSVTAGAGLQIHDRVCLANDYDTTRLPNETTTPIKLDFWNLKITKVDDISQEITMTADLAQSWIEPRLITDFSAAEKTNGTRIAVAFGISKFFWKPDLFIYNLTAFKEMKVLMPLAGFSLFTDNRVQIFTSAKFSVKCDMDFAEFPMDSQLCHFSVGSTTYSKEVMPFSTNVFDASNRFHPDQTFRIFTLNLEESETELKGINGDYSLAGFRIQLVRYAAPFFLKYHLPCLGIVVVSHVSFVITPLAIPGRVALLVTLFLVLTTFFANVQANQPKSLGMTAISSYILVCILFLFLTMLVLGYHLFIHRQSKTSKQKELLKAKAKEEKKAAKRAAKKGGASKSGSAVSKGAAWDETKDMLDNAAEVEKPEGKCTRVVYYLTCLERYAVSIEDKERYSRRVDRNCFIAFSLSFFIYNIVYTIIYNTRPIKGGPYDDYMPE